jgi:ElaB/YqjD/DUF883 family membrane-anchored ribosome-binding protein
MASTTDVSSQSTEQVKERVQDVAQQAKGRTGDQLREQIDARSSQAGEQVRSTAQAVRQTSSKLREDGQEMPAKALDQLASHGERLGDYLAESDGGRILRDVENVARRQPWLFVGGSAVVGFLASRFMKASSGRRYRESDGMSSRYAALPPSAPAVQDRAGFYVTEDEPVVRPGGGPVGYGQ